MVTVLALGLDPNCVDLSKMPGLTPELVLSYIDSQLECIRALGYEVDSCLVDSGKTAEEVLKESLRKRAYDCVMIGAGLRAPEQLILFERLLTCFTPTVQKQRYASTQRLPTQPKPFNGGFEAG